MTLRAGVIGCGNRGRRHAAGYLASDQVELVACAEPKEENRLAFCEQFHVARAYTDYREMLAKEKLDLVSICTWTGQHREMIEEAARSGVRAIHSEKPMATTWGDAKALYQVCQERGVVITFCHQRRFEASFVKAKQLLDAGAIGDLYRMEAGCDNMFDWGTHWFDMFFFFNNEEPAEWVIAQIDVAKRKEVFAAPVDTGGVSWVRFGNGVEGLLTTGSAMMGGARIRLLGSEGIIEIMGSDGAPVRIRRRGAGEWEPVALDAGVPNAQATVASVLDLLDALKAGREPLLSGRKALQATELIFATYESSRRRGQVRLPLDVEDSALIAMLDTGMIGPKA